MRIKCVTKYGYYYFRIKYELHITAVLIFVYLVLSGFLHFFARVVLVKKFDLSHYRYCSLYRSISGLLTRKVVGISTRPQKSLNTNTSSN